MALIVSPFVVASSIPIVAQCITAVYPSGCGPGTCVDGPNFCIPQHDDRRLVINFVDPDGAPFNIAGAAEITFIISRSVTAVPSITKTLTGGTLARVSPTMITVLLSNAETGGLRPGRNYYECRLSSLTGAQITVLSGFLEVQDTRIGD